MPHAEEDLKTSDSIINRCGVSRSTSLCPERRLSDSHPTFLMSADKDTPPTHVTTHKGESEARIGPDICNADVQSISAGDTSRHGRYDGDTDRRVYL